ncbi:DUF2491 family protein [Vibrio coralliirubri]|uniref:DUF2491 family protein n=1 Tax=Vibrio coralliirubri TaxID=1516159 RepID=UPI002283C209|nr:DUF2491 family protein [Vibrio coralliirubri]MCY9861365.1 DUF2491 family protein [Vibrio coralliirubri]
MFDRIKSLLGMATQSDEPSVDLFANDNKATHGIELGHNLKIEYPILSLYDDLEFNLSEPTKKVTGISVSNDSGNKSFRAYTEDDCFLQFDFFGDDKVENLSQITIMQYQLDDGDEFLVYTPEELESFSESDFENGINDQLARAEKWKQVIDFDKTFEFRGHTYHRFNDLTLGGIEVVELVDDEINAIDNNFSVFVREMSDDLNEVLFVNAEQGLVIDDQNEITERSNSMTVSISLGVTLTHSSITVNRYTGK